MKTFARFGCAVVLLVIAPTVTASPTGFTSRADFDAAVAALDATATTRDFDALSDGTLLPSGDNTAGIVLGYDFGGVTVEIRRVGDAATLDTVSEPNYAGTDDGGVFQDGDDLTLAAGGQVINALGLSITSIDAMQTNDIVLSLPGSDFVVGLDPRDVQSVLDDGASEFFLGIVDAVGFGMAALETIGGGFFLHTIDDVTTATAPDTDDDGVADAGDNCLLAANIDQTDSDDDAIGNACDPDIAAPNDCFVNFLDLTILTDAFFANPASANWNADADFNGDDIVNFLDLTTMADAFFDAPGPSGVTNICG